MIVTHSDVNSCSELRTEVVLRTVTGLEKINGKYQCLISSSWLQTLLSAETHVNKNRVPGRPVDLNDNPAEEIIFISFVFFYTGAIGFYQGIRERQKNNLLTII